MSIHIRDSRNFAQLGWAPFTSNPFMWMFWAFFSVLWLGVFAVASHMLASAPFLLFEERHGGYVVSLVAVVVFVGVVLGLQLYNLHSWLRVRAHIEAVFAVAAQYAFLSFPSGGTLDCIGLFRSLDLLDWASQIDEPAWIREQVRGESSAMHNVVAACLMWHGACECATGWAMTTTRDDTQHRVVMECTKTRVSWSVFDSAERVVWSRTMPADLWFRVFRREADVSHIMWICARWESELRAFWQPHARLEHTTTHHSISNHSGEHIEGRLCEDQRAVVRVQGDATTQERPRELTVEVPTESMRAERWALRIGSIVAMVSGAIWAMAELGWAYTWTMRGVFGLGLVVWVGFMIHLNWRWFAWLQPRYAARFTQGSAPEFEVPIREVLSISNGVLSGEHGGVVDLKMPFDVHCTRALAPNPSGEGMLGVEVVQRAAKSVGVVQKTQSVAFQVPVQVSTWWSELPVLNRSNPAVEGTDFDGWLWPALVYYAEQHGGLDVGS